MFNFAHYTSRKLGAIALLGTVFLVGVPSSAYAWDNCREVSRVVRIDGRTYFERGLSCRDDFGRWVFVDNRPRYDHYDRYDRRDYWRNDINIRWNDSDRRDRYDDRDHNHRDHGWKDKKRHKRH